MTQFPSHSILSRRTLLQTAALSVGALSTVANAAEQKDPPKRDPNEDYYTHAKGIRILPGQWRPHYPWEHIAWVSPRWPSQDYIWLDFPEAIFTKQGLLYLSHVNPRVQAVVFPDPPPIQWSKMPGGIAYERILPNGIAFGGKITVAENAADLELYIRNKSDSPLNNITLQTCFFLRAISEFGAYTADNKFVHAPDKGWLPFQKAQKLKSENGQYRLGWRGGPKNSDLPIMVTVSSTPNRLIACTWGKDTYSLICNPGHPCMHADPHFPDLSPGDSYTIRGKLIFFEGSLDEFDEALRDNRLGIGLPG
ncbi:MAG: hypothetical protein ABIH23_13550 [bacterium]